MIRAIIEPPRSKTITVTLEFSGGDAERLYYLSRRELIISNAVAEYDGQQHLGPVKDFLDRLRPILRALGVWEPYQE